MIVTIEVGDTLGVGVETTAIRVAFLAFTRMWRQRGGVGICLPDVHLIAAGTYPSGIKRAIDPGIHAALGVAITRAVVGASRVVLAASPRR